MATAKTETLSTLRESAQTTKPRGLWSDAWKRLKKNRMALLGAGVLVVMSLVAILADVLAPKDPAATDPNVIPFSPPFWSEGSQPGYPLGVDAVGRDFLSRLIHGARISMIVGFVPMIVICLVGITVGMVAGWVGGRWDNIIMRLVDVVYAFPSLLFFIVVQVALRDTAIGKLWGGLFLLFIALAVVTWVDMARLVRGQVLSLKNKEFVESARSVGVSTPRILFRHILPNCMAPVIVAVAFGVPSMILAEATLSFLGLGAQGVPSWGGMVFEHYSQLTTIPSLVLMPSAVIALVMLSFTFLGDGLRDALDPQMSK
jgi:oligopeptide transport system permease protein